MALSLLASCICFWLCCLSWSAPVASSDDFPSSRRFAWENGLEELHAETFSRETLQRALLPDGHISKSEGGVNDEDSEYVTASQQQNVRISLGNNGGYHNKDEPDDNYTSASSTTIFNENVSDTSAKGKSDSDTGQATSTEDDPGKDHETSPTQSPVYSATLNPTMPLASPGEPGASINHSIRVPMSVAIYQYDQLTQNRITVLIAYLLNVMCGLLDTHTPFDFLFSSTIPNSGNDTNDVANAGANKDFPKRRHSKRKRILKESKIRGRNSVLGGYRFPREMQDTGSTGSRKGDDYDLLARLYFSRVAVWESPSVESWLQVSAEFDVYWPNGDPVLHWKNLEQIEWACVSVLNTTINTNIFWSTLVEEDPEGEYVVRRGKRWGKRDKAGIAAVDTFKNEYILDFTEYETDDVFNDTTGKEGYQYSDRLELEWEVREWFGLGLCLATLVFASLLAILSVCLQRRQETQEIWGLTEGGVRELLAVGWTYHQEAGADGQLFLKVYDKKRVGYNDENSILQGGVHPTSGGSQTQTAPDTATMDTPPSPYPTR